MRGMSLGLALAALALAPAARAEPRAYRVARQRGGAGIVLEIPYSLGTHSQTIVAVLGELQLDREALAVSAGRLVVPLAAIRSDSPERDCHLRESLGLDYTRSRFPREHVCDGEHRLPASGGDSPAFPDVRLDVKSAMVLDDPKLLREGKEVRASVEGTWTVHGVSRPARIELKLSKDPRAPEALRVRGHHAFRLRDYGVVVKSAKVLFATISVEDEVTAFLDLTIVPAGARRDPSPDAR